jgi:hypothetical protein
MRKLLALLAVAFVVALVSVPASAQGGGGLPCTPTANGGSGGAGCTITVKNTPMDFGPAGPFICPNIPSGELWLTANGVFHFNVNRAGDFWITSTLTGPITILDSTGKAVLTGHAETWFGQENNMTNGVTNEVFNATGTNLLTGQSVRFHMEGHAFYVPDTNPPVFVPSPSDHLNSSCG